MSATSYTYIPIIHIEVSSFVKARDKRSNKAFANYQIVATVPSPFKRWKIERRYCQFEALYKYFCRNRRLKCAFPHSSLAKTIQLSGSLSAMASTRLKPLEALLIELVELKDLTVKEINQLYSFLDVSGFVDNDLSQRDSDFGYDDIRRDLFYETISNPGTEGENSTDDGAGGSTPPAIGRRKSREVIELNMDGSDSNIRYSDIRKTDDLHNHSNNYDRGNCATEVPRNRIYSVSSEGLKESLRNNDITAVKELLKKTNNLLVTQLDDAGNPAIYTAALYGAIELGCILISAGADPHVVNRQGISAMDIAFDPWRIAIQQYINKVNDEINLSEMLRYELIKVTVPRRQNGSLGLNIVKSTENTAVVVGYTALPSSITSPSDRLTELPAIRPNDVIYSVNDIISTDFDDTIQSIKNCPGSIQLTLQRAIKKS